MAFWRAENDEHYYARVVTVTGLMGPLLVYAALMVSGWTHLPRAATRLAAVAPLGAGCAALLAVAAAALRRGWAQKLLGAAWILGGLCVAVGEWLRPPHEHSRADCWGIAIAAILLMTGLGIGHLFTPGFASYIRSSPADFRRRTRRWLGIACGVVGAALWWNASGGSDSDGSLRVLQSSLAIVNLMLAIGWIVLWAPAAQPTRPEGPIPHGGPGVAGRAGSA